jgi:hypothetical protein
VGRERLVVAAVDEEQADDPDHGQRDELEHRRGDLDDAALARAEDVGRGEQPDQGDADERAEQLVVGRRRPELGQVADEGDGDRGVAGPHGDPVAPRRLEADEVAERPLRVRVRPAHARQRTTEVREHERQQHGAGAGEQPAEHGDRTRRTGQRRRQQEDAGPDHVAHDQGRGHPQAHRSLELRAAVGVGSRFGLRRSDHRQLLSIGSRPRSSRRAGRRSSGGRAVSVREATVSLVPAGRGGGACERQLRAMTQVTFAPLTDPVTDTAAAAAARRSAPARRPPWRRPAPRAPGCSRARRPPGGLRRAPRPAR